MTQTPDELRARAKQHFANWRSLWTIDPDEAREELDKASNLAMLAGEIEQSSLAASALAAATTTRPAHV